jgi:hypothetical protein
VLNLTTIPLFKYFRAYTPGIVDIPDLNPSFIVIESGKTQAESIRNPSAEKN